MISAGGRVEGLMKLDHVTAYLIEHGIQVCQRNWIVFSYFGEKDSLEQLEGEEIAGLPDGFEDWPVDEEPVN